MKIAVFTIVRNEKEFLPIWYKHYKKYFKTGDIYIIDNDTTDGSTDGLANVVKKSSECSFDTDWLIPTVQDYQKKLLKTYNYVLFTEIDEIIFPFNASTYEDYINIKGNKECFRCTGYEVIHQYNIEPEIDIEKPLMMQRNKWYMSKIYCKTLLTRIPLKYGVGFHNCCHDVEVDDDLIMIHLHKIDLSLAIKRNQSRLTAPLNDKMIASRKGWQNITLDVNEIKRYFNKLFSPVTGIENIPEKYKHVI